MRSRLRFAVPPALALGLQSCAGVQSTLEPHGPAAARIAQLWWLMLALGTVVALVVCALLGYAVLHRGRRRAPADEAPSHGDSGERRTAGDARELRWVVGGGVVVPLIVLTLLLTVTLRTLGALRTAPADLTIEVDGHQFWWDVRYLDGTGRVDFRTANELRIPVGTRVQVRLVAHDVIHSFWVPNLAGKVDMIPGRANVLQLHAERPGTYRGQCAEYCGVQHAKMAFLVVAEPPAAYERWAALQRQPAAERSADATRLGRQLFVESDCAACHDIRGVSERAAAAAAERVGGRVGPDLTHLASRRTLAAGTIPNTRGHLGGWIGNPQGVKPGSFMPAVALGADELIRLLDYLQTLR